MKAKTTKPKRIRYVEGDWFQVPLAAGVAVGVLARKVSRGGLGYFFLFDRLPSPSELARLRAKDADFIGDFGALGIEDGSWPLLGRPPDWDRSAWPVPRFAHKDAVSGEWFLRTYGDELGVYTKQERTTATEAARHPEDGTWGFKAVETWLARLVKDRAATSKKARPRLQAARRRSRPAA